MYIKGYYRIMNTIRISATAARNNFFELLDKVSSGMSVIIEKDNKTVAHIVPTMRADVKNKGLTKALYKAAKGFSYTPSDNPLRKKGALNFLKQRELI